MNDVVGPRRYGDEEIARILKRATEIQVADPTALTTSGMTLQELEEIAAEAGIDPRHLRRAAMELEVGTSEPTLLDKLVGARLEIELGTIIPGELPAAGFERVLSIIQQVARHHGQGNLLGHTLTWQGESANGQRSLMVVVSTRDGETSVRIEERLHGFAGGLFGGMVGGGGMGIGQGIGWGLLGSMTFAVAFPVGFLGLSYVSARAIYRNRAEERRRVLTDLLDRIVREASESIDQSAPDELPTPASSPPRIGTPGTRSLRPAR
jgi:hypothetical protein